MLITKLKAKDVSTAATGAKPLLKPTAAATARIASKGTTPPVNDRITNKRTSPASTGCAPAHTFTVVVAVTDTQTPLSQILQTLVT